MNKNIEKPLWRDPSIPKDGWHEVGFEDNGDPSAECQMCLKKDVRYIHILSHSMLGYFIRVGCVCRGHLTGDPEGAKASEAKFKKTVKLRAKITDKVNVDTWKTTNAGNKLTVYGGSRTNYPEGVVLVFKKGSGFAWNIKWSPTETVWAKLVYETEQGAAQAAVKQYALRAVK